MSTENGHQHGSLNDLFEYPLMSALVDRRTRRLARGTSTKAGPLTKAQYERQAAHDKLWHGR